MKEAGKRFEIIFCSSDRDVAAFEDYHKSMPWLALPFGDARKKALSRYFEVSGIYKLNTVRVCTYMLGPADPKHNIYKHTCIYNPVYSCTCT